MTDSNRRPGWLDLDGIRYHRSASFPTIYVAIHGDGISGEGHGSVQAAPGDVVARAVWTGLTDDGVPRYWFDCVATDDVASDEEYGHHRVCVWRERTDGSAGAHFSGALNEALDDVLEEYAEWQRADAAMGDATP